MFVSSPRRILAFSLGLLALTLCDPMSPTQASSALPGFTGVLTSPTAFSQAFQSGAAGLAQFQGQTRAFINYGAWETGEVTLSIAGTELLFHAKYTLLPESPRTPALAIGGTGLLGHDPSVYVVAGGNVRVREGGPQFRLAGGVATRGVLPPLFASAEVRVSPAATLVAEWAQRFNVGVRVNPTAQFRVLIGLVRRQAALGISYDIGL